MLNSLMWLLECIECFDLSMDYFHSPFHFYLGDPTLVVLGTVRTMCNLFGNSSNPSAKLLIVNCGIVCDIRV